MGRGVLFMYCNRRLNLKKKRFFLISILGIMFFVLPLSASGVLKKSVKELTVSAEEIIKGKVKEINSQWDDKKTLIYSQITIEVKEIIKGESEREEIVIKQLGGSIDNIRLKIAGMPLFKEEEEVILFLNKHKKQLKKFYVTGLCQGKFAVKNEKVERNNLTVQQFIGNIKQVIRGLEREGN